MKCYGLIGYPLAHTFSEKYFNSYFRQENIPAIFRNFPLEDIIQVKKLIGQFPYLQGLAVTIPFKKAILAFLDELTWEVQQTGACNCIKIQNGKCIGYNTDILGFEKSFLPQRLPHENKALILGTGGASSAVQYVLQKNGIEFLLVSRVKKMGMESITYEDVDERVMQAFSIIINTTPVGQFPFIDDAPSLPYAFVTAKHYLYDLVYNPGMTQFLKQGELKGARIKSGLEMLEIQAKENWKIWSN